MVKHARTAAQIRGMMDETERCVILSAFAILGLSFCVGFKAQPPRSNRDHLAFQNFKILKCSMRTQAIDLYGGSSSPSLQDPSTWELLLSFVDRSLLVMMPGVVAMSSLCLIVILGVT